MIVTSRKALIIIIWHKSFLTETLSYVIHSTASVAQTIINTTFDRKSIFNRDVSKIRTKANTKKVIRYNTSCVNVILYSLHNVIFFIFNFLSVPIAKYLYLMLYKSNIHFAIFPLFPLRFDTL